MDVVVVFNGLGNQMSQYAFYLSKKNINTSTYFFSYCKDHNGFELDSVFGIKWTGRFRNKFLFLLFRTMLIEKYSFFSTPLKKLFNYLGCKIVSENFNYIFNNEFLKPSKGITFYYGGWHSEKYFISERDIVLSNYEFNIPNDNANIQYIADIKNVNSIALHVRRGDYLNETNINLFGGVCTKGYFEKAICAIESHVDDPHFFVFSNDIDWVIKNLSMKNVTYITCNVGKDSWKDMYLMSLCKHNIISNSSFSWWGAWLNNHKEKIVVSPSKFLNNDISTDFYPDSWIKLNDY